MTVQIAQKLFLYPLHCSFQGVTSNQNNMHSIRARFELPDQGSLGEQQLLDIFASCFRKTVAQQIAILFAKMWVGR